MIFTPSDAARVRETAQRLLEEHHFPGIAVGVVSGDDLVFSEAFGYADIESKTPMAPQHRHRIASVTKTMTALCIMALVDEGRLSVNDRVTDLIPELSFKGPYEELTVWHLLTHTGGIGETPNVEDLPNPFRTLFCEEPPPRAFADCYPAGITIEVPPGTKYAYANHGFLLLGEIIERIEERPAAEVFRDRIFEPLGMTDSALDDQPHPDQTTGYHSPRSEEERAMLSRVGRDLSAEETIDGYNVRGETLYTWGNGAQGGARSTIPDIARYASALLRRGAGIVRPEAFDLMIQDHWRPDKRLPGRGLGFGLGELRGRPRFGHTGEYIGGWHSALNIYPDQDLAIIVHINATFPAFEAVANAISEAVFGLPPFVPAGSDLDPQLIATAPGVYQAAEPGPLTNFRVIINAGRIQVSARDGGLVMHSRRGPWKHGVPLLPVDPGQPDLLVVGGEGSLPALIVALRDDDGAVTGLRFQQIIDMYRTEEVQPWA
jgi:CubicO group peptidase (beta-lactamase class C family)